MASSPIEEHALRLIWSLWTELGVPGLDRHHAHVALDLEPIVLYSPMVALRDARLVGQIEAWCLAHATVISVTRLRGLLGQAPEEAATAFSQIAAALNRDHSLGWPEIEAVEPSARVPPSKPPPIWLARPALQRIRFRALAGIGARADVICELLARSPQWSIAASLVELGYTKRNIARILSELVSSGFCDEYVQGTTLNVRLNSQWVQRLTDTSTLAWPRWIPLFQLVDTLLRLVGISNKPSTVRRVGAHKAREEAASLGLNLGLPPPPPTRGVPEAWDLMMAWGETQLAALADGTSPAFQRR